MTQIIKRYWKWDERLNDTPYKLGSEISCLLRKGLVHPYQDVQDRFLGLGEGAARHIEIEVSAGKIDFVTFSSPYGSSSDAHFPTIQEGLWDMEEPKFMETLNSVLGPPCEPTHGDYLFVVFRGGFVTMAIIFRRLPK
jgi:hypothetical protein